MAKLFRMYICIYTLIYKKTIWDLVFIIILIFLNQVLLFWIANTINRNAAFDINQ